MLIRTAIENALPAAAPYAPDLATIVVAAVGIALTVLSIISLTRDTGRQRWFSSASLVIGILLIGGALILDSSNRLAASADRHVEVERWLGDDFGIVVNQDDVIVLTRGADSVWRNWVAVDYEGERTEIKLRDNADHSYTVIDSRTGRPLEPTR